MFSKPVHLESLRTTLPRQVILNYLHWIILHYLNSSKILCSLYRNMDRFTLTDFLCPFNKSIKREIKGRNPYFSTVLRIYLLQPQLHERFGILSPGEGELRDGPHEWSLVWQSFVLTVESKTDKKTGHSGAQHSGSLRQEDQSFNPAWKVSDSEILPQNT